MTYTIVAKPMGKGNFFYYGGGPGIGTTVAGLSRYPLLDACRDIQRIGGDTNRKCAMYHLGSKVWAARIAVGMGAGLMVQDTPNGSKPRFVKYYDPRRLDWHRQAKEPAWAF
jgi:hypothetical protein